MRIARCTRRRLCGLAIAQLDLRRGSSPRARSHSQCMRPDQHALRLQPPLLVPLHDDQRIARAVLARRRTRARRHSRARRRASVPSADRACRRAARGAVRGTCRRESRSARASPADTAPRNSANGRSPMKQMPVLSGLACTGRPARRASSRTCSLCQSPSGKQHASELCARARRAGSRSGPCLIVGLKQRRTVGERRAHARSVRSRSARPPSRCAYRRHSAELDLAVAQHVRIGRAAGAILLQEQTEHALAVLGGEIHPVQHDAQLGGDRARILIVLRGRAVHVVLVPVAHEQALHVAAGVAEQQRRDGGVDAAGQAHDDPLCIAWGAIVSARAARFAWSASESQRQPLRRRR